MILWVKERLAHLEAQNRLDILTSNLQKQKLFPEIDELFDPKGDPPPSRYNWGDY